MGEKEEAQSVAGLHEERRRRKSKADMGILERNSQGSSYHGGLKHAARNESQKRYVHHGSGGEEMQEAGEVKKQSAWEPIERGEQGFSKWKWRCFRCKAKSERAEDLCPECGSEMKITYLCDPDLNATCSKTGCFITEKGMCRHTTRITCARDPAKVYFDKWAEADKKFKERMKRKEWHK